MADQGRPKLPPTTVAEMECFDIRPDPQDGFLKIKLTRELQGLLLLFSWERVILTENLTEQLFCLTLPVTCRRPNVTIHVHPNPQPGGSQVKWLS